MNKHFQFLYNILRVIILFVLVILFLSCFSNKLNLIKTDSTKGKLHYNKEKIEGKSIRYDSSYIIFFKNFNDTINVYKNSQLLRKLEVFTKNNPAESSGYSGISVRIKNEKYNIITIELLSQKIYISFKLDSRYRYYDIQYNNNEWYVRARNKTLIIR